MISGQSAIPTLTDALVKVWQDAGVAVYDGPGVTSELPNDFVLVGLSDPDSDVSDEAARSDQQWAWLGHVQRDETGTIHCVAVAIRGDLEMKPARDAVFATMGKLSAAIQADPSLGTDQPCWVTGIQSGSYRQGQTDDGAQAAVLFDVEFRARLE